MHVFENIIEEVVTKASIENCFTCQIYIIENTTLWILFYVFLQIMCNFVCNIASSNCLTIIDSDIVFLSSSDMQFINVDEFTVDKCET